MASTLEQIGKYNDFTDEFRNELEERINSFGDKVRYKFNIGRPDPHPDNRGQIVYPSMWTLDPVTFDLIDPYEKRPGKPKMKKVGLGEETVNEKNEPTLTFERVRVFAKDKSIFSLDLKNPEGRYMAMLLEIHPKNNGGKYQNHSVGWSFSRIDEKALSTERRAERSQKAKALSFAQAMSDAEVDEFADALGWDKEDMGILRDKVEAMAEDTPAMFNDLIESKRIEYQSVIKKALDKEIIGFDPSDYKFIWASSGQTLAILTPSSAKSHVEKLAEWFQAGDEKTVKAYNKIKSLTKA